jgi:hypothetical protein
VANTVTSILPGEDHRLAPEPICGGFAPAKLGAETGASVQGVEVNLARELRAGQTVGRRKCTENGRLWIDPFLLSSSTPNCRSLCAAVSEDRRGRL